MGTGMTTKSRKLHRLTALAVSRAKTRGYVCDGGGLYLQISSHGSKSWVFRYRSGGRLREAGLGPLHTIGLSDAREKARECRKLIFDGLDPIAENARKSRARLDSANIVSFEQCAETYISAQRPGWKSVKHAAQWSTSLEKYVYPVFKGVPVHSIDVTLVIKVLEPLWQSKTETAARVRGRIESILDWATVRGFREGDNPARWRGRLDKLLPQRHRVQKVPPLREGGMDQ
jgi:hypothetical protein